MQFGRAALANESSQLARRGGAPAEIAQQPGPGDAKARIGRALAREVDDGQRLVETFATAEEPGQVEGGLGRIPGAANSSRSSRSIAAGSSAALASTTVVVEPIRGPNADSPAGAGGDADDGALIAPT